MENKKQGLTASSVAPSERKGMAAAPLHKRVTHIERVLAYVIL